MTIFGEEHFLDKTMLKIAKQIDNEVFDNIHKASLKIGVEVDKDKLKHWLILCGRLENIDQSNLIDLATKRKFDEKDLHIAKLEEEKTKLKNQIKQLNKDWKRDVRELEYALLDKEEKLNNAIVPKFKVGQEVWFILKDNKGVDVFSGTVRLITLNGYYQPSKFIYTILQLDIELHLEEKDLFATEAEAQKYLKRKSDI